MKHLKTKTCSNCDRVFRNERDILRFTAHWRVCENDFFWFTCICGSTLIMQPDEVEWFTPGADGQGLLSSLVDRKVFPRLPLALVYLQQVLEDDDAAIKAIAQACRRDPVTAAGILLIANRMRKSSGNRITSLEHAVSFIGRDMVKLVALTSALGSLKFMTSHFSAVQFWSEAFLIGAVCEYLAPRLAPHVSSDEAYIAGALCNIGKVVNAIYVPQVVDKIAQETSARGAKNWETSEQGLTPFVHTKSGEFAGVEWGLPAFVIEAIREHHSLPKFGIDRSEGLTLVELVAFANQLAHVSVQKLHRLDKDIFNSYSTICHFTKDDIKHAVSDLQPAITAANSGAVELTRFH